MMDILNKIYNWFFDRETDKEEEWEVSPSESSDIIDRYHKFMMQVNEDNLNHSRETHKFNKSINDFESFEVPKNSQIKKHTELTRKWQQEFLNDCFGVIESDEQDYSLKTKYYKRKVKIFHGLQGFNWEYAYNFAEYGAVMRSCGYTEITKDEYEENVK
jgi:hypothetical protein